MAVPVSENEMSVPTGNINLSDNNAAPPNPTSLSVLLSDLISAMENELTKLSEVVERVPAENLPIVPSTLPSTGGRPACHITKAQTEQLRDTGMNWRAISTFLGISEKTLQRRRTEFGIHESFSNISDTDLDRQVTEILQLTPYSGESYVRGSLKGRKVHVQRAR